MATTLEKELRLIRERLDSTEDALGEEMSEDDKRARAEALKAHRKGRTVPFVRKHTSKAPTPPSSEMKSDSTMSLARSAVESPPFPLTTFRVANSVWFPLFSSS